MAITATRGVNGMIPYRTSSGVAPKLDLSPEQIKSARATKLEIVADQEQHESGPFNFGDDLAGSLHRVIESLVAIRESVPEEYRAEAFCEFRSRSDYDGGGIPTIQVSYRRPETDEEVVERLSWEAHMRSLTEQEERATLAALQSKYAAPPLPDKD